MQKRLCRAVVAVSLLVGSKCVIASGPYFHRVYDACLKEVQESGYNASTVDKQYLFIGKLAACLAQQSRHSENVSIKNDLVAVSNDFAKQLAENGGIDEYNDVSGVFSSIFSKSEQKERDDNASAADAEHDE